MKMSVVIQAGGESKRMGQNKALIPFLGQPLIQRVIDRVKPVADELLIITNHPDEYQFFGIPAIPDLIPGIGALGGLYTAFSVAKYQIVAVVACDMAFVNPILLSAERDFMLLRGSDGVVPHPETGFETFHSVFARDICASAVKASIDKGYKRADCWFDTVKYVLLLIQPN